MRILVIEDEPSIVEFLKSGFEAEGFSVDSADNGSQGSFLARTNSYDIIILDNVLPGKQGLQVCHEIRLNGKGTPIIMLSGISETITKVSLLDMGADDYVTKPFSFGELLARVRAVLRRPSQFVGQVLAVGDLIMNTETREVIRSSKEINFSKKESALLEYFMRNPGRVISRTEILEHVWDMHGDPFSNTVETHVMRLRKKLEIPGSSQLKIFYSFVITLL